MENVFEKNRGKFLEYIKNKDSIVAIYLFGSYCDGTYNEKSDIDLAVLYDGNYELQKHLCDSVEVQEIFDNINIDYIDFREISLYFQFSILKKGKIVYCKDKEKLYNHISKVQHQYIEMSHSRKKYVDYVLNHDSLEEKNG